MSSGTGTHRSGFGWSERQLTIMFGPIVLSLFALAIYIVAPYLLSSPDFISPVQGISSLLVYGGLIVAMGAILLNIVAGPRGGADE